MKSGSVLAAGAALPLLLLSSSCATEQRARYERLSLELSQETPAVAADPAEGEGELDLGADVLELERLRAVVLERNPTLAAAREAWRAALEQLPQATALDDPMLMLEAAPLSAVTALTGGERFGGAVRLSQRFPFPGKLALRGDVVLAEAEARRGDLRAARQSLALLGELLFYDWWFTARELEVLAHHEHLLADLREAAEGQFAAGRGTLQDPLQAEVELAALASRRLEVEAERDEVRARLNALLRRAPEAPLPPPPSTLPEPPALEEEDLQQLAVDGQPSLASARSRSQAAERSVELAKLEYLPDFSLEGTYTTMFSPQLPHQLMVGGSLNLPLQLGSRAAAVREAEARLRQERAEAVRLEDEVRAEVETLRARVHRAREQAELYRARLRPAAEAQLEAARGGFEAGNTSFLAVVQAENNLRSMELGEKRSTADAFRQLARLERALGRNDDERGTR